MPTYRPRGRKAPAPTIWGVDRDDDGLAIGVIVDAPCQQLEAEVEDPERGTVYHIDDFRDLPEPIPIRRRHIMEISGVTGRVRLRQWIGDDWGKWGRWS